MDNGQFPPPYAGPQMVPTNISYQTPQVTYQTQPAPVATVYPASYAQMTVMPAAQTALPGYACAPVAHPVVHMFQAPAAAPAPDPDEVIISPHLTTTAGRIKCNYCRKEVVTEMKYVNGTMVWVICASLGICMIWPCCLIPLCVKGCKDVEHRCPHCKTIIHVHKPM